MGKESPPGDFADHLQRTGIRMEIRLPLHCRLTAVPAALPGQSRNVSFGGICVLLPQALPPGTPVELAYTDERGTHSARAEVVWNEPKTQPLIPHGLCFTDPAKNDFVIALGIAAAWKASREEETA